MVTRRPFVRPAAEAAELRRTPVAVEALVPDGKQRDVERLVSEALRKRYGGWEFRITVKVWEPQHVVIVLDAVRPPGSSAPPAPPTDSAAAAELMSLLDNLLEQQFPHLDFTTTYQRISQDQSRTVIEGKKDNGDPPTCADGAPTEPPLLDSRDESTHGERIIQNQKKKARKPWCFIHCMSIPASNAWPPSLMLQQIGSSAAGSTPADCRSFMWVAQALSTAQVNGVSIALAPGQTFAYKIPPGYQVTIAANQLPNCIVWWQGP